MLVYDLLLAKKGVALPSTHGLNATISKHRARLAAELTKARIRRGFPTVDALRASIDGTHISSSANNAGHGATIRCPRWIRINVLRTSLDDQLGTTFAGFTRVQSLKNLLSAELGDEVYYVDEHIPNLVAVSPQSNLSTSKAYAKGELIFQDKASCFPAYLLNPGTGDGDIIDACAAPGNKATHLAALVHSAKPADTPRSTMIIACERDAARSETLQRMVKIAGGEALVSIRPQQDFLRLDPSATKFANVTALLLDPSCSGSGIVGRDEGGTVVHLPKLPAVDATKSRKRKRSKPAVSTETIAQELDHTAEVEESPSTLPDDSDKLEARLTALSSFQLRLLEHAMNFSAARRITYSTCSVHAEENEHVVVNALLSAVAEARGWQILKREQQVDGMRRWLIRGSLMACQSVLDGAESNIDPRELAEACIRCEKGTEDGTMGFFVAGFARGRVGDTLDMGLNVHGHSNGGGEESKEGNEPEEEWEGFSDKES